MCRVTGPNQHSMPAKTNLHVTLERNLHLYMYIKPYSMYNESFTLSSSAFVELCQLMTVKFTFTPTIPFAKNKFEGANLM